MELPDGENATWALQVFRNNEVDPIIEVENQYIDTSPTTAYRVIFSKGATSNGTPCNYGDPGTAWSTKNPNIEYFTTGDTLYTNSSLTTAISYTGYVAQYVPGSPSPTYVGPVYEITAGIVGDPALNQC
jgi:hypothetical protein